MEPSGTESQTVGDMGEKTILVDNVGDNTAEIVVTPTDAAAAGGDIGQPVDNSDVEIEMGGKPTTPVVATAMKPIVDNGVRTSEGDGFNKAGEKKHIDDLFPATDLTTTKMDGCVKLRMDSSGEGAIKPTTVQMMMRKTVQAVPKHLAMAVKRDGQWQKWTYQQYYEQSTMAAKGFIKLGLQPYHGVGILGFNSPEWFISYVGAIFAGGKSTGIYTTNSPAACEYVLSDCQANIVVVENHAQLQKILEVWEFLPHVKAIVQYTGEVAERRPNIYSWDEFLALSNDVSDAEIEKRFLLQAPNTCCSLIYTSGTTGNPKAVMISHDNCTWTAYQSGQKLGYKMGTEISVTFLPLSHIAAQMLDILMPLCYGVSVYFAQPDALKGTLGDTWKEVRPTGVLAVPRVWEKIMEKMIAVGSQSGSLKKKLVLWAKAKGKKGTEAKMKGESMPWGWGLANALVFKTVRKTLGLDRCRLFGSAAAPIMKETLDFFASLNIRIDECYGMSECTGPHTFCTDNECRLTSVGKEMASLKTKFDNPDADGNGEICYWGRHIFMGYLNQPEKTEEAIASDGWLHSGDIGRKDEDGYLYITGRIKELIITAGGENIAPVPVEDSVKEQLPCVSNCMLIGDKRKFISLLITLKTDMDLDTGAPMNTLAPESLKWCKNNNSSATTVQEVIMDQVLHKVIQEGIDKANEKAVSRAAKIQKWTILPADFSLPGGELGPTLKLRRPIVVKKYEKIIEEFYS
ncbi:hypothetical protein ACF0H5_002908 [Mactra antiquata]